MRKVRIPKTAFAPVLAAFFAGLAPSAARAQAASEPLDKRIIFSGMLDADFASDYGSLDQARHATGLEADLTTMVLFNPRLYAVVRTTFRDGTVPRQGAGNTWAPLLFDGAQINWKAGDNTVLMAGDLVGGSGYFQYYRYKRSAAVVGEHTLRGAGLRWTHLTVHAGMASDTAGVRNDWSVFAQWRRHLREDLVWTHSLRYTFGIPDATPFELGLSFEARFDDVSLTVNAHSGMQYWSAEKDPGFFTLIEPRYVFEPFFFNSTVFLSDKGEVPSPNAPRHTAGWKPLDDVLLQLEPGIALNPAFSASLSLEFRDPSLDAERDASLWFIPTLYVYPAPRAQWWLWTALTKPLRNGPGGAPRLSLGSEIAFTF